MTIFVMKAGYQEDESRGETIDTDKTPNLLRNSLLQRTSTFLRSSSLGSQDSNLNDDSLSIISTQSKDRTLKSQGSRSQEFLLRVSLVKDIRSQFENKSIKCLFGKKGHSSYETVFSVIENSRANFNYFAKLKSKDDSIRAKFRLFLADGAKEAIFATEIDIEKISEKFNTTHLVRNEDWGVEYSLYCADQQQSDRKEAGAQDAETTQVSRGSESMKSIKSPTTPKSYSFHSLMKMPKSLRMRSTPSREELPKEGSEKNQKVGKRGFSLKYSQLGGIFGSLRSSEISVDSPDTILDSAHDFSDSKRNDESLALEIGGETDEGKDLNRFSSISNTVPCGKDLIDEIEDERQVVKDDANNNRERNEEYEVQEDEIVKNTLDALIDSHDSTANMPTGNLDEDKNRITEILSKMEATEANEEAKWKRVSSTPMKESDVENPDNVSNTGTMSMGDSLDQSPAVKASPKHFEEEYKIQRNSLFWKRISTSMAPSSVGRIKKRSVISKGDRNSKIELSKAGSVATKKASLIRVSTIKEDDRYSCLLFDDYLDVGDQENMPASRAARNNRKSEDLVNSYFKASSPLKATDGHAGLCDLKIPRHSIVDDETGKTGEKKECCIFVENKLKSLKKQIEDLQDANAKIEQKNQAIIEKICMSMDSVTESVVQ
ncbi:MAG: hypothetical protein MHMPM18_001226 [Marteilia pararefringens]